MRIEDITRLGSSIIDHFLFRSSGEGLRAQLDLLSSATILRLSLLQIVTPCALRTMATKVSAGSEHACATVFYIML